ncbi:MAG: ABC transporter permease [Candidatus Binataceae bacterium]|jgi:ABC-2 type transport system permease protein
MHYAWQICLKDLRQRFRDRTLLIVAVIAPLALTGLIGMALGGSSNISMRLGIADLDRTQLSGSFVDFVKRPPRAPLRGEIVVLPMNSRAAAAAAVTARKVESAVVLAPGFGQAARTGNSGSVEILAGANEHFATMMTGARLRDFLNRAAAGPDAAKIASVTPRSPGGLLRVVDFFAASMTVLFLTFAVLSGVQAMRAEVDDRTLLRLMASPAAPAAIMAGKFGALLVIGLTQLIVMIVATSVLFGTRWGNPFLVAALAVTSVLMAIGLTAFLMSLAKNAEQGMGLAALVIALLSVVGGQFLPPHGLPDVFETLTRLTPNGQAFFGFLDLSAAGSSATLSTIAQPLLVTGLVGVAGIVFAAYRARSALERMT